jgi:hypothetical protein
MLEEKENVKRLWIGLGIAHLRQPVDLSTEKNGSETQVSACWRRYAVF